MTQTNDPEFAPIPLTHPIRAAGLSNRKPTHFNLKTDAETRNAMAQYLGITAVRSFSFKGSIVPIGRTDFELTGALVAVVEQPCAITLTPVLTDINETVERRYLARYEVPEADEVEMPEDVTEEQLGDIIDVGHVAIESLMLALPLYPRADGAELTETAFAAEGTAPLRDEDLRPFAGLAALRDGLAAKADKDTGAKTAPNDPETDSPE